MTDGESTRFPVASARALEKEGFIMGEYVTMTWKEFVQAMMPDIPASLILRVRNKQVDTILDFLPCLEGEPVQVLGYDNRGYLVDHGKDDDVLIFILGETEDD